MIEQRGFPAESWPDETLKVAATATRLSDDGRQCEQDELLQALMDDNGWTREEAWSAIEYAEYMGAIWEGPSRGEMLQ